MFNPTPAFPHDAIHIVALMPLYALHVHGDKKPNKKTHIWMSDKTVAE